MQANRTILIADDEPSLRLLVKATLKSKQYTLIEAVNGKDALNLALHVQPDLILLDVMMPYMTGFQVCTELRNHAETKHTPVMILTAKGGSEDKNIALASGANFFLTKPFRPPDLLAAVEHIFTKIDAQKASSSE